MSDRDLIQNLDRLFADIPETRSLTRETEQELVRRSQQGESDATNQLIVTHLAYVAKMAMRYRNLGVPMEDLIHEGTLGLIEATRRFDNERGHRFLTYATFWIRRSILETLRRDTNLVRQPASRFRKSRQRRQQIGLIAVTASAASPPGPTVGRGAYISIERCADDTQLHPRPTGPPGQSDAETGMLRDEQEQLLRDAISGLTPDERAVISRRFGLHDDRPWKLREIGDALGKTRERVRQIEMKARHKLRGAIRRRHRSRPSPRIP